MSHRSLPLSGSVFHLGPWQLVLTLAAGSDLGERVQVDQNSPLSCSAKRPAGVSGILSHIGGKKSKMSTLEKSKMDWDAFKSEEGIGEELAIHNRGREG